MGDSADSRTGARWRTAYKFILRCPSALRGLLLSPAAQQRTVCGPEWLFSTGFALLTTGIFLQGYIQVIQGTAITQWIGDV